MNNAQFSGRNDELSIQKKKSCKRLCITYDYYSIIMDKYWWFWQNDSFFSVFSLSHIITEGEGTKRKSRNNLLSIGI